MTREFILEHWLQDKPRGEYHRFWYKILFNHRQIMAVASVHFMPDYERGLWRAYIGVVPGKNLDLEWPSVAAEGEKVSEAQAREWFPDMPKELEYDE